MKTILKLHRNMENLYQTLLRFPLTIIFLLVVSVLYWIEISTDMTFTKEIYICFTGVLLSIVAQVSYERFMIKSVHRYILALVAIIITCGYYGILVVEDSWNVVYEIKTWVIISALFLAFIWIPVIHSRYFFHENFVAVFKSFFLSLFYTVIWFGGSSLVLTAINTLITGVSSYTYSYLADITFVLFAPLLFLSKIPKFPGKLLLMEDIHTNIESMKEDSLEYSRRDSADDSIDKAVNCPKFLEVLFSYIIIPLTSIYMVILVIYIVKNIQNDFWSDYLLEPLLITYSIIVIIVYLLTGSLENGVVLLFRKIFPKILIPMVMLQIIASILQLKETGITHTGYYMILYGVFAVSSGFVISIVPVKKSGILAGLFVALSLLSLMPFIGAFPLSQWNQEKRMEAILQKHDMLIDNQIQTATDLTENEKNTIVASVQYLYQIDALKNIDYIPDNFQPSYNFASVFGFEQYSFPTYEDTYIYLYSDTTDTILTSGYDILFKNSINNDAFGENGLRLFSKNNTNYQVAMEVLDGKSYLIIQEESGKELIKLDCDEIFQRFKTYSAETSTITSEQSVFTLENEEAILKIVIISANLDVESVDQNYFAEFYVLAGVK